MTRADRLRSASVAERVAALQELAATDAMTSEEQGLVLECLGDERKTVQRRAVDVITTHAPLDPAMTRRLDAIARSGPWLQRWGTVFALARCGTIDRAALPTLLEALSSTDGDVRWAAADLLKQLAQRDEAAVAAALIAAARGVDVNQRKMALYILRDLRCMTAGGAALDALTADAIDVRLAGLAALVALTHDRAVTASHVAGFLDDADARMQRAAAATLGQLKVTSEEVLAALGRARTSADASLRRAAEQALKVLTIR